MKTAQGKYNQAGTDIILNIYFDLKAFDLISPAMTPEEEDDFIRLSYDSLAAALPKDEAEKNFYIKRIIRKASDVLRILCSDGFLIDDTLSLSISQQAFAKERIKIIETEQLPKHLNFRHDLLKIINEKLPIFEKEAGSLFTQNKRILTKEMGGLNTSLITTQDLELDKAFDLLTEASRINKEIKEITTNNEAALLSLAGQINKASLLQTNSSATSTLNALKETVMKRAQEFTPMYNAFSKEENELVQLINKQTNTFTTLKQCLIENLFESAKQCYDLVFKQMQNAPSHIKMNLTKEFNKKFSSIAFISESGELSSLEEANKNLNKFSLDSLEKIISNEDKQNPGLLQKCNSSWAEESPELQIILSNLRKLNKVLFAVFQDDEQLKQYTSPEMVTIIRKPFPRGFQFKFSSLIENYVNSIGDFCKTQKENLLSLEKKYKKTAQINDILDKAPQVLANANNQAESKLPQTVQSKTNEIEINKAEIKETEISKLKAKAEINETELSDAKINDTEINQPIINEEKVSEIKANQAEINETEPNEAEINKREKNEDNLLPAQEAQINQAILPSEATRAPINKFAVREMIMSVIKKIDAAIEQNNKLPQRSEAKNLLLSLIKNQYHDPLDLENLDKNMLDLYTKLDLQIAEISKIINELLELKNELTANVNPKQNQIIFSQQELTAKLQIVSDKIKAIDAAKEIINKNLSSLKKLSLSPAD
jgi:hypothetical protein